MHQSHIGLAQSKRRTVMDRNRPDKTRRDNRVPQGLSFLMWPALVRAPWLMGDILGGSDAWRDAERRRKRDR
jgi:hypothetical protein